MNLDLILANRPAVSDGGAAGGLVEAVRPVAVPWDGASGTTWIGGAPLAQGESAGAADAAFELVETGAGPLRQRRLRFDAATWRGHYAETANAFLWPLLHLSHEPLPDRSPWFPAPAPPTDAAWRAWRAVNAAFADAALAAGGECCWVQDYQLGLVPALLRAGGFGGRTGFFLHTPFPDLATADPFLPPPARARFAEWLAGLLGADLAGVQTEGDAARLREAAERLLGARVEGDGLRLRGRLVRVAAFPAGIDAAALADEAASAPPAELRGDGSLPLVVGLERADYTKGVPERLAALRRALADGARFAWAGFSAPTREAVPAYAALRAECERLAADCERLARARGLPFRQEARALPRDTMLGLLRDADVVFTSSLADGMNLVPLQAAVAQSARPAAERGVVLAGRHAGVCAAWADFAADGIAPVDPLDEAAAAAALREALAGRPARIGDRLAAAVRERDAHAWGRAFLAALDEA